MANKNHSDKLKADKAKAKSKVAKAKTRADIDPNLKIDNAIEKHNNARRTYSSNQGKTGPWQTSKQAKSDKTKRLKKATATLKSEKSKAEKDRAKGKYKETAKKAQKGQGKAQDRSRNKKRGFLES